MKLKREFRGFTLIELMIVIAIIGILTAVVVPAVSNRDGASIPSSEGPGLNAEEKFESFVDDDCVAKYGEFACSYDKSK